MYDAGTPRLRWGEAVELIAAAINDTTTFLGADMQEMDYPADPMGLLLVRLVGALGGVNEHDLKKALPYRDRKKTQAAPAPKPDEYRSEAEKMLAAWGITDDGLDNAVKRQANVAAKGGRNDA